MVLKRIPNKYGIFWSILIYSLFFMNPPAFSENESRKPGDDALEKALKESQDKAVNSSYTIPEPIEGLYSRPIGSRANLRLIDIALVGMFAAGGSTEPDSSLRNLQGGFHDPRQRGFNVQAAELSISGAVDPYFRAESNMAFTFNSNNETIFELEEIFATTQALPWGVEVEVGQSFHEFGIMNPLHAHEWDWMDQAIIISRIFGGDGQRSSGARVGWLLPLPWYAQFHTGVYNARGETLPSFLPEGETIGGRPFFDRPLDGMEELLYLARLETASNITRNLTTKFGGSFMTGPNSTGENGRTWVYGVDFLAKYVFFKNFRGYPFIKFQTEFLHRLYDSDLYFDPRDLTTTVDDVFLAQDILHDYGFYTQVLVGFFKNWEAGLRYEYVTGDGPSIIGRNNDPFRDDRHRVSPLIAWRPSEFSRLRLQANYDNADHLGRDDVLSVWAGLDILIGSHPAHKFQ